LKENIEYQSKTDDKNNEINILNNKLKNISSEKDDFKKDF